MVRTKKVQAFDTFDRRLVLKRLRDEKLGLWGLRATLVHCLKSRVTEALSSSDFLELLVACRKVGDWSLAWQCFQKVKAKFPERAVNAVTGNACMSTCSELRAWQISLEVLSHMKWVHIETDLVSCNSALDAFGRRWQKATALLKDSLSKHLECDLVTCNSLVRAYKSSRLWWLSLGVVSALPCFGWKADPIMKTLNAACADTLWQRAAAVMSLGRNEETEETRSDVDILACNALANCAARGQAWEKAMTVLQTDLPSIKPDVVSFNTVLSAFERSVRWTCALEILRDVHLRPNSVTLGTVGCACASGSAWEWTLMDSAMETKASFAFWYSATVSAFASVVNWKEALSCFRTATKTALSEQLFSATMLAYGNVLSHWSKTFHLLSFWKQRGLQTSSESMNAVFQVCYKNYLWRSSLELQTDLCSLDSSGLSCLARSCGHAGAWLNVMSLLTESQDGVDSMNSQVWSSKCWSYESSKSPVPVLRMHLDKNSWRP